MTDQQELWVITSVQDTTVIDPLQGASTGKLVRYRLFDGTAGQLKIPDAQFEPTTVENMINDAANKTLAVLSLKGPVIPD